MACILIVEDDAGFEIGCRRQLEPMGHELVIVRTAEEALEVVGRKRLDLAVVDLILPGMDGAELIRRLRADEATSGMPIVVFTCMIQQMSLGVEERDKVWLPADEVIDKTEGTAVLARKIERLLKESSAGRGESAGGPRDNLNQDNLPKE